MKPGKVALVVGGTALLFGCAWCAHLIYRFDHPSTDNAQEFFANFSAIPRGDRSAEVERFFLSNDREIFDTSEYGAYVFEQFTKVYRETADEAMLVGLDSVDVDAHFAEVLCDFYRDLVEIPQAAAHYRTPDGAARLRRCRGAWSEEELRRFLGPLADVSKAATGLKGGVP